MTPERIVKLRTAYVLGCRTDEIGNELFAALTTAQSKWDEARAKLASLVPGVVRIPEPTTQEREQEFRNPMDSEGDDPWSDGFDAALAWARTHAEVVVEAVVLPELTEALLDEIAGPFYATNGARRVGVRDAWVKFREMGFVAQRPGWSILSSETHEVRPYSWFEGDDLIHGVALYKIGASEDSVPLQRYRLRAMQQAREVAG